MGVCIIKHDTENKDILTAYLIAFWKPPGVVKKRGSIRMGGRNLQNEIIPDTDDAKELKSMIWTSDFFSECAALGQWVVKNILRI